MTWEELVNHLKAVVTTVILIIQLVILYAVWADILQCQQGPPAEQGTCTGQ